MPCCPRVFEEGAQRGVRQAGATVELVILQLRKHPEALCIAFKAQEVPTLGFTHIVQPAAVCGLLEPVANRVFTRVAERRIADVMGQAGRLHHHPQVGGVTPVGQGAAQGFAHPHAQGTAHAADFQGMGQACVNVIVAGDGMNLRLAAQASEGARENDAVMIFMEWAAPEFFRAVMGFSEAFAIK